MQFLSFTSKKPVCDSMDSNSVGYTYSHNTLNHSLSLIDHVCVHKDVVTLISDYKVLCHELLRSPSCSFFWDLSLLSVINGYINNIYVNNNMSVSL